MEEYKTDGKEKKMNETIKIIENLKTIRKFSDKNIKDEDLLIIMKSSVNAATASARQTYSIIAIENREVMKEIGCVGNKLLIFCVDFNRMIDTTEYLGFEYVQGIPLVDFITGSTDTILAAQTASIAAKSMGIDSLFSNCVHRGDMHRLFRLLKLPEKYCFPIIALALGYSDEEESKRVKKGRLSGPGIIHFNEYKRANAEELENIVLEYDDRDKNFLSLLNNWEEKGYNHYLDYFYEVWCGYEKKGQKPTGGRKPERNYSGVEEMLIKTGFLRKENCS